MAPTLTQGDLTLRAPPEKVPGCPFLPEPHCLSSVASDIPKGEGALCGEGVHHGKGRIQVVRNQHFALSLSYCGWTWGLPGPSSDNASPPQGQGQGRLWGEREERTGQDQPTELCSWAWAGCLSGERARGRADRGPRCAPMVPLILRSPMKAPTGHLEPCGGAESHKPAQLLRTQGRPCCTPRRWPPSALPAHQ